MTRFRSGALRCTAAIALLAIGPAALAQITGEGPWADDPAVQAVLAQRRAGLEAMMAGTMSAETERYSTTFVANTPGGGVVTGEAMLRLFSTGGLRYSHVEQRVDYAGSHGPDVVVIMGEEIVVPGAGMANAGQRVRRRFTDVFRRENGEWRHDLRHANVLEIEAAAVSQ
jgi:hypothetical protein